jgi:DNA repair protein RadD
LIQRLTLFPDQRELKAGVYQSLRSNSATLAQACTGFGKSALAVDFCLDAVSRNKTVTINVPRRELARQLGKTLTKYGLSHGYIASGTKPNPFAPIQISLTESLARRLPAVYKSDLLITDECHVGGESLTNIVNTWKDAGKKIIGLSATPRRMDGKGMNMWFDDMVCGPQMRWLIDNGRLNQYKVVVSDEALKQATAAGASEDELDRVMFGDAVKTYRDHANGLRTLVFCRTIKHAEDVAAHYCQNGIPSAAISSKTSDEMARIVMAFARREILCLMNVQIASFGWDLMQLTGIDATVECVQMLRFSSSLPLYMQIAGRFLRLGERDSVFIDHCGAVFEHGLPCAHREWTLEGRLKGEGEFKEKLIPTRQCPIEEGGCGMVHKPSPACPRCGRVYPVRDLTVDVVDSDMVMLTPDQFASVAKGERQLQGRAQTLPELIELGKRRGVKNPTFWAKKVMEGRRARG